MSNTFRWHDNGTTNGSTWSNEQEPDPGDNKVKFTSISRRLGAILIDWGLPLLLISILHGALSDFIVIGMWANSIWWQGTTGQSLGKRALGLRLAYVPEGKDATTWTFIVPGVGRCAARYVLHFLDFICFIGFFKALINPQGRSIADACVDTVVIADGQFDLMTAEDYRQLRLCSLTREDLLNAEEVLAVGPAQSWGLPSRLRIRPPSTTLE